MTDLLEEALLRLPRKGDTSFAPSKEWFVALNLHEWARSRGFLTGVVFVRTFPKRPGRATRKTKYKLLLVGPCPWEEGRLRFYTIPLPGFNLT